MDDGKRFGVHAGLLGVAFHCAPARAPEDRSGGVGGRTRLAHPWAGNEAECLEAFGGSFSLFCVFLLVVDAISVPIARCLAVLPGGYI